MKLVFLTFLLCYFPLSLKAQSDRIKIAIKTIEDLSYEENTFGTSEVDVNYDAITEKVSFTKSFFLTEDNYGTYRSTFYLDDVDKASFEAEITPILDGYSVDIRIKTDGNNVEFWSKDMDKKKFFKPIIKTEFRNIIILSNNKILPKSFALRYLDSIKILIGIEADNKG